MIVVLVVDDEFGIATLLEDVFVDEGYKVLVASNGQQALDRIAEEQPALIITDYMMPVMDGATLVKRIASNPALSQIPIIITSSLPEAAVAERCSGYKHFLRKPFRIYDVVDLVENLLRNNL